MNQWAIHRTQNPAYAGNLDGPTPACTAQPVIGKETKMTRNRTAFAPTEPEAPVIEETCVHHWLIEPAKGPTSMGICKYCGSVREFSNQFRRQGLLGQAQPDTQGASLPDENQQ